MKRFLKDRNEAVTDLTLSSMQQNWHVIQAANGACYGIEFIGVSDDLDAYVEHYVTETVDTAGECVVLDVGGAGGYRADLLGRLGAKAYVVDICDHSSAIRQKNESHQRRQSIAFTKADVRDLMEARDPAAFSLPSIINHGLIHARRIIHWMPWEDVERFVRFMPEIAGNDAHLALCLQYSRCDQRGTLQYPKTTLNNFYAHHPMDVLELLDASKYEILFEQKTERSLKLFAKIPVNTHCC